MAIELCEQHYAEGIGWFDQRSLELEPRQWRQLQSLLGQSGPQIRSAEAEAPAIVAFPGPVAAEPRRRAVGDQP